MIRIGIVGDIGSGKSYIAKQLGYPVFNADNEVNKRIEDIGKNQNNFVDKNESKPSENGDLIVFDYLATIEGKSFEGGG